MNMFKKTGPFLLAAVSGGLLLLSFPPFKMEVLGWVGLVPLILACKTGRVRRAAGCGWLAGAVFFVGSLYWLRNVSWLGCLALACYCALYFMPFAMLIAARPGGWGGMAWMKNIGWMVAASMVWAASEYVRATLFTGFPWNLLGISQYEQISLIQVAEFGGVYLLSALMVFFNTGFAGTVLQYVSGARSFGYKMHAELLSAILLLAAASSFGLYVLFKVEPAVEPVHVAMIQPNIPEVGNWDRADPELVYQRLTYLSDLAAQGLDLDLMIWPETALPDLVRYSQRSAALVKRVAAKVPLLTGSMDKDEISNYYNGSMLFSKQGELLETYYKQHLVLFGEYIPFDGKIAWIDALTPIDSSFTPGRESPLFHLPGDLRGFSVLICFEDTVPYLARRAARKGSTWLVNQTNDSWFDPDSGSIQHLSHAVFRTVENRLPMVRCTNTGMTCSIDSKGRIQQTLGPRIDGFHIASVRPADLDRPLTFYTRYGDCFAQACLLASVALCTVLAFNFRKTKPCLTN